MEELDGLCYAILDTPSTGIVAHDELGGRIVVVGDDEGGLVATRTAHDDLSQLALVVAQSGLRLVNDGVCVFSFEVRDVDTDCQVIFTLKPFRQ